MEIVAVIRFSGRRDEALRTVQDLSLSLLEMTKRPPAIPCQDKFHRGKVATSAMKGLRDANCQLFGTTRNPRPEDIRIRYVSQQFFGN